jgi:DNA-binding response OmpR family regulator/CBS domain-containing protein
MPTEFFHAVACSTDRLLLRRLTRLLHTLGCRVDPLAHVERGAALLAAVRPDFVVIDGELPSEAWQTLVQAALSDHDAGPPPVILALISRLDTPQVTAALAAGADDVLHKPLVPGEVLSRIRAAARLREQQWRRHLQLGNSATLGCLPAPAWRALAAEFARQRTGTGACMALQIDHCAQWAAEHGKVRAARLRTAVVDRLQDAGGDGVVWGELEGECIVALLTSSDEVAALAWAERLRIAAAERPFEVDGQTATITTSMGVAPLKASEVTGEEQARGALQLAQHSGGDCVVSAQEWQKECRRASDEPSWLDSANAWDIMIPHPLALYPEDTVEQAQLLLAQTQLAHLPVVDGKGELQGLVSARSLQGSERKSTSRNSGSIRFVRTVMQGTVAQFDEETPVRKLQSHFAADPSSVVVITRQGRPLGLVYRDSLAGLEEHLTRRTFATKGVFSLDSDYLTTPETCGVEE